MQQKAVDGGGRWPQRHEIHGVPELSEWTRRRVTCAHDLRVGLRAGGKQADGN